MTHKIAGRLKLDSYESMFKTYVHECLRRLGKRFDCCEQCGKPTTKLDIHHTKYAGATIYDLQLVCRSCNLLKRNKGLA